MQKSRIQKEIWVSIGMTLNLGNYESAKIDAGLTIPLENNETYKKAFQRAWDEVSSEVKAKAKQIKKDSKTKVKKDTNVSF
jgi:predicted proteasome-type protease